MELARKQFGMDLGVPEQAENEGRTSEMAAFIGFCAFSVALQLYDNYALMTSTNMFNGSLYASIAQVLVFVLCAIAGFTSKASPPRLLAPVSGVVAAACALFELCGPLVSPCVPCCMLMGCAIAALSMCWGFYLGKRPSDVLCLRIVAALFMGSAVTFVLFAADEPAIGEAVLVVALAASGVPWLLKRTEVGGGVPDAEPPDAPRFSVPATTLVTLVMCCLLSAFFSGVTINPYGIQSKSIDAYMHLITTISFGLVAASCIIFKMFNLQAFTFAALAALMVGLLVMSTGMAGSVVVPMGLILAMRSLSWGLGWVAIVALARANSERWMIVCGLGFLASNGALGRGVGMLLTNATAVSFGDLTVFGVACITVIALVYALMNTTRLSQIRVAVGFGLRGRKSVPDVVPAGESALANRGEQAVGGTSSSESIQFGESSNSSVMASLNEGAESDGIAPKGNDENLLESVPSDGEDSESKELSFPDLRLTDRELLVARMLAVNAPYADIAERLGIAESTAKYHAKHVFEKAGVVTKREFFQKYSDLSK